MDKNHGLGEKRSRQRRITKDRRKDIRFEPYKENRRENPGRRSGDKDAWHRHED